MDITYYVFNSTRKNTEIKADEKQYGPALRLIGCRKIDKDLWSLNPAKLETLDSLIKNLGGNPENQRTVEPKIGKKTNKSVSPPQNNLSNNQYNDNKESSKVEEKPSRVEKESSKVEKPSRVEKESSKVEKPSRVEKESSKVEKPSRVEKELSKVEKPSRVENELSKVEKPSRVEKESSKVDKPSRVEKESSKVEKPSRVEKESSKVDKNKLLLVKEESESDIESEEEFYENYNESDFDMSDNDDNDENDDNDDNDDESEESEDEIMYGNNRNNDNEESEDESYYPISKVKDIRKDEKTIESSKPSLSNVSRIINSPTSRSKIMSSSRLQSSSKVSQSSNSNESRKNRNDSRPEYTTKYSNDKISYYKTLGKRHVEEVDDSSTEYSDSSDDFPSPSPVKRRNKNERDSKVERRRR